MFHRVGREKRPVVGELVLGVCAKGIIVYEMKNHVRTVTRRFLWRETDSISTGVKNMIFLPDLSCVRHYFTVLILLSSSKEAHNGLCLSAT